MRVSPAPCFAAFALLIGSCSFVAGGDIETRPCLLEGENDFAAGNALCRTLQTEPPADECQQWVCRQEVGNERYCTLGAPDEDDDGVGDAMCLGLGAGGDCDDADPDVNADAPELCDGKDNDCDGMIDEGVLQVGSPTLVGELDASQLVFGTSGERVAALYRRADGALALWRPGSTTGVDLDNEATGAPLVGRDGTIPLAVTPIDGSRALVGAGLAGCERIIVGVADASGAVVTTDEHFESGLPATDGNACPARMSEGAPAGRALSLAADGDGFVATWLEANAAADCRAGELVSAAGSGGVLDAGADPASAAAATLGDGANVLEGTAALPLASGSFLLGRFDAPGRVALDVVNRAADGTLTPDFGMSRELPGNGGGLALVRGERTETFGGALVLSTADCDAPLVVAQRLLEEEDGNVALLGEPITMPDGGRPQRSPAAAYAERPVGYLVAWLEGNGARAQLLGDGGALVGAPLDVVDASAFEGSASFPYGLAVTPRAEGGFDVHVYVQSGVPGIYRVPVGCGE